MFLKDICRSYVRFFTLMSRKTIFSLKVKVKVKRLLTLVSFERALIVEYACQINTRWKIIVPFPI